MRILLSRPDHAKHIGKRLSRELDLPLTRGYVIAANILGYASWDDLLSACTWPPGFGSSLAAWPDSQCMPLAVVMRRAFQADSLVRQTGIAPDLARQLVERIRPSDGFVRPIVEVIRGRDSPRQHDPKLGMDDHARMSAALHRVWQFAGRQRGLSDDLRTLAYALEALMLNEWPMEQFCTTIHDSCYSGRSPTYLDDLRRAPRWLSDADHAVGLDVIKRIESQVFAAGIQDLDVVLARVAEACKRCEAWLLTWRLKSRPHDGKPLVYDGAPRIEDEAIALLQQHLGISGREVYALEDPDFDELRTRKLLARIEAMPSQHLQRPPLQFAIKRLKGGLRWLDKHHALQVRERQPLLRDWDLWAVGADGDVAILGRVSAETSLDAINAGPNYLHGRVVATPAGAGLHSTQAALPAVDVAQPELLS